MGVPAAMWALGSVVMATAYADLKVRPLAEPARPVLRGRVPVFFALALTPAVFGLILWFLLSGLEADFGSLSGIPANLAFWCAAAFAFVSAVVVGAETWISRSRIEQFASEDFGRVLPLVVIPETAAIFALILVFLTIGVISGNLDRTQTITDADAWRIVMGLQVYAVTTLAYPVAVALSNRIRDFSAAREWIRALVRLELASAATIVGFVWAFWQMGAS